MIKINIIKKYNNKIKKNNNKNNKMPKSNLGVLNKILTESLKKIIFQEIKRDQEKFFSLKGKKQK